MNTITQKQKLLCDINEKIEQQNNCKSGDISPIQSIRLEEYTNKLADLVAQIVVQNQ
jgi:hypothetical protein